MILIKSITEITHTLDSESYISENLRVLEIIIGDLQVIASDSQKSFCPFSLADCFLRLYQHSSFDPCNFEPESKHVLLE